MSASLYPFASPGWKEMLSLATLSGRQAGMRAGGGQRERKEVGEGEGAHSAAVAHSGVK